MVGKFIIVVGDGGGERVGGYLKRMKGRRY